MKLKLAIVGLLSSLALLAPGKAESHLGGNCSTITKFWQVWSYGIYIYYRQLYLGDMGGTNNTAYRRYRTDSTVGGKQPWVVVDYHTRACNIS